MENRESAIARRKAVLSAAKELGYRPNAAARSLVQQRTHTVGALLSDMRNPWFIDLLESARSELLALGLNLFLSEVDPLQNNSSVSRCVHRGPCRRAALSGHDARF